METNGLVAPTFNLKAPILLEQTANFMLIIAQKGRLSATCRQSVALFTLVCHAQVVKIHNQLGYYRISGPRRRQGKVTQNKLCGK